MKRLSGLDASFLYSETRACHMHTLKIAVCDPPASGTADAFARLHQVLGRRIHLLPVFRWRAVDVPLGLHHPVWVDDPNFQLADHLRYAKVSAPGTQRELDEAIGAIAGRPLQRDRPLWELWLLDGLADGRLAFVAKVHHAVADGGASAAMLANIMSADSDADVVLPLRDDWTAAPLPSNYRLVVDAVADLPRRARDLPPLVARTLRGARALMRRARTDDHRATRPFDTPRTPLGGALEPARTFATTTLPLADVLAVKRALGVTVNDVVLALVAGSLRSYLARGPALARSLVATVPVGVAGDLGPPRLRGNRLSNLFASLHTDIADPVQRVRAIHDAMVAAKRVHEDLGPNVLQDWTEYSPRPLHAAVMSLYSRLGLANRHRPPANVIVSNVRGPASELHVAGARLHRFYSVGPILDGIGLNVTAWSYADQLSLSALACPTAIPDLPRIAAGLADALAELVAAVSETDAAAPQPPHEPQLPDAQALMDAAVSATGLR